MKGDYSAVADALENLADAVGYMSASAPLVTTRDDREVNITDAACEVGLQLEHLANGIHRIADSFERQVRHQCGKAGT